MKPAKWLLGVRLVLVLAVLAVVSVAWAVPTHIAVRVLSKDGKFVGDDMGVEVTIKDFESGEVLAEGLVDGGPGDSERILKQPRRRGTPISTERSAKFEATIDIDTPRRIQVVARGPLRVQGASNTVSSTQWVVPGRHLTGGDGWLLELPGFAIEILEPLAGARLSGGSATRIDVDVTPMCGCPITPGGLWDADKYEIRVLLNRGGERVDERSLPYAGKVSRFATEMMLDVGDYEAVVYAFDASNGNTGVATVRFTVSR